VTSVCSFPCHYFQREALGAPAYATGRNKPTYTKRHGQKFAHQDGGKWVEAIAMDTWDPYIKAVNECCPQACIVFDQFHMVKTFGRVIYQVRKLEYQKATTEGKEVIKGSKYLLLKDKTNLLPDEEPKLKRLLELN
jgi:transposase